MYFLWFAEQADASNDDSDLLSVNTWFKSRSEYGLYDRKLSRTSSVLDNCQDGNLNEVNITSFHTFQFTTYYHHTISWCYTSCYIYSTVKYTTNTNKILIPRNFIKCIFPMCPISSVGLKSGNGCAGDAWQKLKTTDPTSRQRKRPTSINLKKKTKLNSMVWVRERTIPTERPPLVGEVIANFCG
jgi:hypothetical protein